MNLHAQTYDPKYWNMMALQHALQQCMSADELEERGQKYRSWDAAHVIFDSNQPILFNFADRKLNAKYAVEEFLWYVRADKNDSSIEKHATAWAKLSQPDGSFFSNYGHYIFAKMTPDGISAFQFAAEQLLRNAGTRRAAIPLLETKHCFHQNVDMVCTFSIQFFIRRGRLVMIVCMRSNDAVWGLTNDSFCFSMLHRLMHAYLVQHGMPNLVLGEYHHQANTLHVYERHYEMASKIIKDDVRNVKLIEVPAFDGHDVSEMLGRKTDRLKWTSFLGSLTS